MVRSDRDKSSKCGLHSCGWSPCWFSVIQFLHPKKKGASYCLCETFGLPAGCLILYFQHKWIQSTVKNIFSLLRGSSEAYQVKVDKLRMALFLLVHDNIKYPRNGNDYTICKSPGM